MLGKRNSAILTLNKVAIENKMRKMLPRIVYIVHVLLTEAYRFLVSTIT